MAQTPIANGDRVAFHPIDFITDTSAYPKPAPHRADKNILKGVSFSLEKNRVTLLVGKTDDLILNRRAVTGACAADLTRIHG